MMNDTQSLLNLSNRCVSVKKSLTRRARGRRESHRQNQLILASNNSVSEKNPVPPAAGNASRWLPSRETM
jgi:hypothetical protein